MSSKKKSKKGSAVAVPTPSGSRKRPAGEEEDPLQPAASSSLPPSSSSKKLKSKHGDDDDTADDLDEGSDGDSDGDDDGKDSASHDERPGFSRSAKKSGRARVRAAAATGDSSDEPSEDEDEYEPRMSAKEYEIWQSERKKRFQMLRVKASSKAKDKEKTKGKKEPERPVRPPKSGYILFANSRRVQVVRDHPNVPSTKILALLATLWKELPQEEKDEINKEVKELKDKYVTELAAYHKKKDGDDNDTNGSDDDATAEEKDTKKKKKKSTKEKKESKNQKHSNSDDSDDEDNVSAPSITSGTSGHNDDDLLSESVFPAIVTHQLSLRDCKEYLKPLINKLTRVSSKEMDKETKDVMGSGGLSYRARSVISLNVQGDTTFVALSYALNAVSSYKDRFDDVSALRREVFTQLETNWSQWQPLLQSITGTQWKLSQLTKYKKDKQWVPAAPKSKNNNDVASSVIAKAKLPGNVPLAVVIGLIVAAMYRVNLIIWHHGEAIRIFWDSIRVVSSPSSSSSFAASSSTDRRPYIHLLLQGVHLYATRMKGVSAASNEEEVQILQKRLKELRDIASTIEKIVPAATNYADDVKSIANELLEGAPISFGLLGKTKLGKSLIFNLLMLLSCVDPYTYAANCRRMAKAEGVLQLERELEDSKRELAGTRNSSSNSRGIGKDRSSSLINLLAPPPPLEKPIGEEKLEKRGDDASTTSAASAKVGKRVSHPTSFKVYTNDWEEKRMPDKVQRAYLDPSAAQKEAAGFTEPLRRYYAGIPFTHNLISFILPSKPDGVPCTSLVTSIHFGTVFHLVLQYMSEQEVKELVFAHIEPEGYTPEARAVNKQRYEALCVQHEELEGEDLWDRKQATPAITTPEEIKLRPEVLALCGKTVVYIGRGQDFDADRMYIRDKLDKVMTDKYARFFIRSPRLYVPSSLLASGAILHDIIGTNDADHFRSSQRDAAIQEMDVVIAISDNSLAADASVTSALQSSGWLRHAVLSDPDSKTSPRIAFAHYVEADKTVHTRYAADFKSKKHEILKYDQDLKKKTRDTFNRLLLEEYTKFTSGTAKVKYGSGTINTAGLKKIPTNAWYGTVYPVLFTSLLLNQLSHHETKYSSEEMDDFIVTTKGYELIGLLQSYSRKRLSVVLEPLLDRRTTKAPLWDSLYNQVQNQIAALQQPGGTVQGSPDGSRDEKTRDPDAKSLAMKHIRKIIADFGSIDIKRATNASINEELMLQCNGWFINVGGIITDFFNNEYFAEDGICDQVSRAAHATWLKRQHDLTNQTRQFLRSYQKGGRQPVEVYHMFFESFPLFDFDTLLRNITDYLNADISAKLQSQAVKFLIDAMPSLESHRAQLQQMIADHFVSIAPSLNLTLIQYSNHIRKDVIKKVQTVFNRHRRESILTHVCEKYDDMFDEHKKSDQKKKDEHKRKSDRDTEFPIAQLRKNIDDAIDEVIHESVQKTYQYTLNAIRSYMNDDIFHHIVKGGVTKSTKKHTLHKALFASLVSSFVNQIHVQEGAKVPSSSRGSRGAAASSSAAATPESKAAAVSSLLLAPSSTSSVAAGSASQIDTLKRLAKELEDWKNNFSLHYQDLVDPNPADLGPSAIESLRRRLLYHELTSSNHRIPQGRERSVLVSRKVAAACRYVHPVDVKQPSFTPCALTADIALAKIQSTLRAFDLEVYDSKETPIPSGDSFFHALAHQLFGDRQNNKTMARSPYCLSSDHNKQFIANERTTWYHIEHRDEGILLEQTVNAIGQFVCAFLNTKYGGEVWIGVDDSGVQGIHVGGAESLEEYHVRIRQQIDMIINDSVLRDKLVTYSDHVVNKRKSNGNRPGYRVFHIKIESGWEHKSSWLMGGKGYSGRNRAELTPMNLVSRQTEWLTQKSNSQLFKGPSDLPVSIGRSPSQGLRAAVNRQTLRWYASDEKHREFFRVWGMNLDDYIGKMNVDGTPISFIELFSICHLFQVNIILWSAEAPPLTFCFKRIFNKVSGSTETKQPIGTLPSSSSAASLNNGSGILRSRDIRELMAGDESIQFAYVPAGHSAQGEPLYRFYSVVASATLNGHAYNYDAPTPMVQFNLPPSMSVTTPTPSTAHAHSPSSHSHHTTMSNQGHSHSHTGGHGHSHGHSQSNGSNNASRHNASRSSAQYSHSHGQGHSRGYSNASGHSNHAHYSHSGNGGNGYGYDHRSDRQHHTSSSSTGSRGGHSYSTTSNRPRGPDYGQGMRMAAAAAATAPTNTSQPPRASSSSSQNRPHSSSSSSSSGRGWGGR